MNLFKRNIIITGASRGIGKSIAVKLAEKGAQVFLLARAAIELKKVCEEINKGAGNAHWFALDITDEEAVNNTVKGIVNDFGRIDVLVNNAGIGSFETLSFFEEQAFDDIFDVNVKGTFLITKAVVPYLQKQNEGHILTIASDVSKRTFAKGSAYCASKYAQDAMMSALRKEVRNTGVKVSVIYPGLVDTYFNGNQPEKPEHETWLRPDDVASAVTYILSAPDHVVIDELMIHPITQDY